MMMMTVDLVAEGGAVAIADPDLIRDRRGADGRCLVVAGATGVADVASVANGDARMDDDVRLIGDFQSSGDEASFAALLTRHRERTRRLLYMLLGGADDVADVEQEVALALWRGLPSFGFRAAFPTYLYRVCRNVAANHIRAARRRRAASFDETLHGGGIGAAGGGGGGGGGGGATMSAAVALERSDDQALVRRTLRQMKADDRLINLLARI